MPKCLGGLITISVVALLSVGGCGDSNFRKYQDLGGLRVLAIKASSPEVAESSLPTTIQLTTVLSDFNSPAETIAITGAICPDPGVSFGADPTCDGSPLKTDLTIASVVPGAVAANSGLFGTPNLTGRIPDISVLIPAGLTTSRSTSERYNGVPLLIALRFTAGTRSVRAYKRILISNKTALNTNPSLTQTTADGAALGTVFSAAVKRLGFQATGQGTYDFMRTDGTLENRNENLRATYFITDGKLKFARVSAGETVEWTPPSTAPSGRPVTVVTVVYDDRGGADFAIQDLQ